MKKVRYMAGMGAAALAPLAAGMVLPAEPANAAVACAGSKPFTITPNGNIKAHGWHAPNGPHGTCIGTVDVSLKFNKTLTKSAFLTISSIHGTKLWGKKAHRIEGTAGTTVITDFAVKLAWNTSAVEVCAGSTYGTSTCQAVTR